MSTSATDPTTTENNGVAASDASQSPDKGKNKVGKEDTSMEEEDDDSEEEESEEEEDDDDEDEEEADDSKEKIDPSAIRSRRTRGVKVDYTSPEALAKAGLTAQDIAGDDDDDEDVAMKED
ncbi:hypothetical protein DFH08DRAFT_1080881 [Mycena albidolilacea]|uniref:Histone chaperone domain-containing protein n=1 Tax=Mycena albidolilacea TaxID=1033008 RepID=A0AAD7A057_9AGAR|nr:hypothetical protein DFH08DRAFT_1080881 [Mycena albidolilacea]